MLHKTVCCLTNESTFNNECKFNKTVNERKVVLKELSQHQQFRACGLKSEHIDDMIPEENNPFLSTILIVIASLNILAFIVVLSLIVINKLRSNINSQPI